MKLSSIIFLSSLALTSSPVTLQAGLDGLPLETVDQKVTRHGSPLFTFSQEEFDSFYRNPDKRTQTTKAIIENPTITGLDFSNILLKNNILEPLLSQLSEKNLLTISFMNSNFKNSFLMDVGCYLTSCTTLNFAGTQLNDFGLDPLKTLINRSTTLKELNISRTALTPTAIEELKTVLMASPSLPRLIYTEEFVPQRKQPEIIVVQNLPQPPVVPIDRQAEAVNQQRDALIATVRRVPLDGGKAMLRSLASMNMNQRDLNQYVLRLGQIRDVESLVDFIRAPGQL